MLAAARASFQDTDEGSLWKFAAVWMAACFCAQVVPPFDGVVVAVSVTADGEEEGFCMRAKRAWSSLTWLGAAAKAAGGGVAVFAFCEEGAMLNPGTDTPACPRRFMADALRYPVWADADEVTGGGEMPEV